MVAKESVGIIPLGVADAKGDSSVLQARRDEMVNAKEFVSRLRYIGNSFEVKETKSFAEDFIERLKFIGKASEEEIHKIASKMFKKR